jgi:hypothetical protein
MANRGPASPKSAPTLGFRCNLSSGGRQCSKPGFGAAPSTSSDRTATSRWQILMPTPSACAITLCAAVAIWLSRRASARWCSGGRNHPWSRADPRLIPANRFAVVHCAGDIHKEDRAWKYLFYSWLPGSGYQPTDDPAMEVYRRHPLDFGWDRFDIHCCLPVRPMRRR